ncbi:hypothetical protein THERMOT_233 [Bathymodiolus thermophilus thioautotrophic gill symbiont]|nr:hypothetical protein THERMOT_233 [Bathymodiolus thermophilus thioautotrophic gill symbiont]
MTVGNPRSANNGGKNDDTGIERL